MRLLLLVTTLLGLSSASAISNRTACFKYIDCLESAQSSYKSCSGGTPLALVLESKDTVIQHTVNTQYDVLMQCQNHFELDGLDFDSLQALVNEDSRTCFRKLKKRRPKENRPSCESNVRSHRSQRTHPYQCVEDFRIDRQRCERLLECCPEHLTCAKLINKESIAFQEAKLKSISLLEAMTDCTYKLLGLPRHTGEVSKENSKEDTPDRAQWVQNPDDTMNREDGHANVDEGFAKKREIDMNPVRKQPRPSILNTKPRTTHANNEKNGKIVPKHPKQSNNHEAAKMKNRKKLSAPSLAVPLSPIIDPKGDYSFGPRDTQRHFNTKETVKKRKRIEVEPTPAGEYSFGPKDTGNEHKFRESTVRQKIIAPHSHHKKIVDRTNMVVHEPIQVVPSEQSVPVSTSSVNPPSSSTEGTTSTVVSTTSSESVPSSSEASPSSTTEVVTQLETEKPSSTTVPSEVVDITGFSAGEITSLEEQLIKKLEVSATQNLRENHFESKTVADQRDSAATTNTTTVTETSPIASSSVRIESKLSNTTSTEIKQIEEVKSHPEDDYKDIEENEGTVESVDITSEEREREEREQVEREKTAESQSTNESGTNSTQIEESEDSVVEEESAESGIINGKDGSEISTVNSPHAGLSTVSPSNPPPPPSNEEAEMRVAVVKFLSASAEPVEAVKYLQLITDNNYAELEKLADEKKEKLEKIVEERNSTRPSKRLKREAEQENVAVPQAQSKKPEDELTAIIKKTLMELGTEKNVEGRNGFQSSEDKLEAISRKITNQLLEVATDDMISPHSQKDNSPMNNEKGEEEKMNTESPWINDSAVKPSLLSDNSQMLKISAVKTHQKERVEERGEGKDGKISTLANGADFISELERIEELQKQLEREQSEIDGENEETEVITPSTIQSISEEYTGSGGTKNTLKKRIMRLDSENLYNVVQGPYPMLQDERVQETRETEKDGETKRIISNSREDQLHQFLKVREQPKFNDKRINREDKFQIMNPVNRQEANGNRQWTPKTEDEIERRRREFHRTINLRMKGSSTVTENTSRGEHAEWTGVTENAIVRDGEEENEETPEEIIAHLRKTLEGEKAKLARLERIVDERGKDTNYRGKEQNQWAGKDAMMSIDQSSLTVPTDKKQFRPMRVVGEESGSNQLKFSPNRHPPTPMELSQMSRGIEASAEKTSRLNRILKSSEETMDSGESTVNKREQRIGTTKRTLKPMERISTNFCALFATCEDLVRDYETECDARYADDEGDLGIDDLSLRYLLVNHSIATNHRILRICAQPRDTSLFGTVQQLKGIQRTVQNACLNLGSNNIMASQLEVSQCSSLITLNTGNLDEFLVTVSSRSPGARQKCLKRVNDMKNQCRSLSRCCGSIEHCTHYLSTSTVHKQYNDVVERILSDQKDCEKRMNEAIDMLHRDFPGKP